MVHNDYPRLRGLFAHLAHVAAGKEVTISPCALISISVDPAAYVIGEREPQCFKVAGDIQFKLSDDVEQACEVGVLKKVLYVDALLIHAVAARRIAHSFAHAR